MHWIFAIATVGLLLGLYFVGIYNRLIALKHNVDEAWSNIDVLLKQRYEELPKLVETSKQYMAYEAETLAEIIRLRDQAETARQDANPLALGEIEPGLTAAVSGLLARAEEYPDLKASVTFRQLLARISILEEAISDRREFYNEAVNLNNIRRELFPDMLVARWFGFNAHVLLQIDDAEKADLSMKTLFNN